MTTENLVEVKTCDLIGAALDWAVATALGYTRSTIQGVDWGKRWKEPAPIGFWDEVDMDDGLFSPSTNWTHGGPVIEREEIAVAPTTMLGQGGQFSWEARTYAEDAEPRGMYGPTPLIAAMRCFASKLGDTVMVPRELVP